MKVSEIIRPDSKFLIKSEYGALHPGWPVVAFSQESFATQIRREYRTHRDFVVYLGTRGTETVITEDRGSILSLAEIDTTRTYSTYDYLSKEDRVWAEKNYPGQWLRCFRVIRGYDIPSRPNALALLPATNLDLWHAAFRKIDDSDLAAFSQLEITLLPDLDILGRPGRRIEPADLLRPENALASIEAQRLARNVFNRVGLSGQTIVNRAPERSAPTNLEVQILELLLRKPLLCALCSAEMRFAAVNKLLKISGDRNDSAVGDYGPENYQLVHLACNLAKNNATAADFDEWLALVRDVSETDGDDANAH